MYTYTYTHTHTHTHTYTYTYTRISFSIYTFVRILLSTDCHLIGHDKSCGLKWITILWTLSWIWMHTMILCLSLQWRHNGRGGVSNHQPQDCLLKRLFRRRSTKTSQLRITGLCVGHSPVTGEFPTQMASNTENVPIWWRHHVVFWVQSTDSCHHCVVNAVW